MKNSKSIAVTGGTGHLGINLIKELLVNNFYVKALIRHSSFPIIHENLTWIKGDLNNLTALEKLVYNCDAIVHSASAISLGEKKQDLVYEVNVTGTQNLLATCLNKPIRFIYISSSTVVEDPVHNEVFNENRPYKSDKSFYYAWTKALAEKYVLEYEVGHNLDASIIRSTAIIGPEDRGPSPFGRTIWDLHLGKLPFITEGGYNMIDVRDLSCTIVSSISNAKKGRIYLVGGEYVSLNNLAKMANSEKIPASLSINLLVKLLPLIRLYEKIFPLKWPITRESLSTLKNAPKNMDCSRASKELGHKSRPVNQSVNDLIEWFHKNKRL